MLKYIIKRILWLIPIIIGVVFLVFTLMYFTPGDPARNALGMTATQEAIDAWSAEHGLAQGFWVRLLNYYNDLLHFDFGTSWSLAVFSPQKMIENEWNDSFTYEQFRRTRFDGFRSCSSFT